MATPPGTPRPKPAVDCDMVINVGIRDFGVAALTIPHLVRTHTVRFSEVCIVIDHSAPSGRLNGPPAPRGESDFLASMGSLDVTPTVIHMDRSAHAIATTNERWFGRKDVADRCAGGTPIYPFIFGLDAARSQYRLHVDCDMLIYDPGPISWVERAIKVLTEEPDVVFANQMMGAYSHESPQPDFYAQENQARMLRLSRRFSSRCFLFDDRRLSTILPIVPLRHRPLKRPIYWFQRRSRYVAFEQMIEAHLHRTAHYRCDLEPEFGFSLHAWDKAFFDDDDMPATLAAVERGQAPTEQIGRINLIRVW